MDDVSTFGTDRSRPVNEDEFIASLPTTGYYVYYLYAVDPRWDEKNDPEGDSDHQAKLIANGIEPF